MFWKTDEPHGLPRNPFKSCIIPRPIGWISSLSSEGVPNLAPYSYFNGVSDDPPMVMFSSGEKVAGKQKDTLSNVEATGEFVCSIVSYDLRDVMNETSAHSDPLLNEAEDAGITMEPSGMVAPMRVKDAPIHLECRHVKTVELPRNANGQGSDVCFGQVIGIQIRDEVLSDGFIDVTKFRPVARLGYMDYTSVDHAFTIKRPRPK